MMSRLLGASRNAYYRYCQRQRRRPSDAEHEAMIEAVKELAQSSDKSNGSRRMNHALNALGYPVGRQKAWSLMREADVKTRYRKKFKVATDSDHKQPVFDNVLAREFTAVSLIRRTSLTSLTSGPGRLGCIWRCSSTYSGRVVG